MEETLRLHSAQVSLISVLQALTMDHEQASRLRLSLL